MLAAGFSKRRCKGYKTGILSSHTVSVIVPVYNGKDIIQGTLSAIVNQMPINNWEIIVVDDNSTDGTANVIQRMKKPADVPMALLEIRDGLHSKPKALATGLAHSGGDIVVFVDSDTILYPGALTTLVSHLVTSQTDFAAGYIVPRFSRDSLFQRIIQWDKYLSHAVIRYGRSILHLAPNIPGQFYASWRGVVRSVAFAETFLEDLTMSYKIAALGYKVTILPCPLAEEESRQSIRSLIKQRIRWAIGHYQSLRCFVESIFHAKTLMARLGILCHPVIYHLYPTLMVIYLALALFVSPRYAVIYVILALLYGIAGWLAKFFAISQLDFDILSIVGFVLLFPLVHPISFLVAIPVCLWRSLNRIRKESLLSLFER